MDETSDDDWTPPTAADLKIIEARQERSNQISKLMGSYMLKGYRMLDRLCDCCETILLQDRQGVDYCVACNELETECAKDDPALSSEAARAAALEGQHSGTPKPIPTPGKSPPVKPNTDRLSLYGITREETSLQATTSTSQGRGDEQVAPQTSETKKYATPPTNIQVKSGSNFQVSTTISELKKQISWATTELQKSSSIESSIQLCSLIKASSEALVSLQKIQHF